MPDGSQQRRVAWVVAVLDGALAAAVVVLAWWTVVFHLAVPLRWPRDVAGAVWVAGLVAASLAWWWLRASSSASVRQGSSRPGSGRLRGRSSSASEQQRWWLAAGRPAPGLALEPVRPAGRWARTAWVVVAGAVAAALLAATRWADARPAWWLLWALVVATAAGAVTVVARSTPAPGAGPEGDVPGMAPGGGAGSQPVPRGPAVALVVGLALAAALGSAVTMRADADDVFLVNRSTHVEQHRGPLPQRDTIFADEVFAAPRPDTVPTSVEALVGVVAAWSPVTAPTVTYLLLGPAAAAAAVLAAWRLLRTLGAAAPAAATAGALGFLLLDGAQHAAFGNLHLTRAWQGKVVFLIVVVPLLWHHALRWGRDRSGPDLAMVAVAHVAAVGLTSTAVFVAPTVTVLAAGAGAWAAGAWPRLGWAALATSPALVAAVAVAVLPRQDPTPALAAGPAGELVTGPGVELAAGPGAELVAGPAGELVTGPGVELVAGPAGELAAGAGPAVVPSWLDLTGGLDPAAEWHRVFGGGVGLVVPVVAVLLAWALVRDRAARAALALAPLALFGLFYAPGALEALAQASGARAVLWRVAWILPVPVAVGLLVTAPALLAPGRARQVAAAAVPAVLAVALLAGSTTALDPANKVRIGRPALDLNPEARVAAGALIELSEPGDVVLAPVPVGGVLAILTTEVRPVDPRTMYMRGRHAVPELRAPQRQLAARAVTVGADPTELDELTRAVVDLEVASACVAAGLGNPVVDGALAQAGLAPVAADDHCTYWRRAP